MKRNSRQIVIAALLSLVGGLLPVAFSPASAQAIVPDANRSVPQDWSHRHVIHTNPDTLREASAKGTVAYDQWRSKLRDPRFAMAVARKTAFVQPVGQNAFSGQQLKNAKRHDRNPPASGAVQRDWSSPLGGTGGVGKAGVFPAKYSFNINADPSCANDFVVFTTASAGASGAFATQTGQFVLNATSGTVTINGSLVLTASTTSNSGLNFKVGVSLSDSAANLAAAINRNSATAGVSAANAAGSAVLTVTALSAGSAGNSIALTDNINGFYWGTAIFSSTTLTGGTDGQPTIVAFNNMYKGFCGPSTPAFQPNTMWSYNTGVNAYTETSPVLSLDGSQVAFVQRSGTAASLVLLKWSSSAPGTLGGPTVPTSVTAANYRSCSAPCMLVIPFNGNPNNTNSSPYVDYSNDVLYVGADNGTLHKFTGVFGGTPAEQTTAGFPATVSSGNKLSSPVLDFGTGLVFVGSASTPSSGGQLHSVNASGTVVSSGRLAAASSNSGVGDSPIVDSTAQRVYAFVPIDTSTLCNGSPCAAVFQFSTGSSISGSTGTKVPVGRGTTDVARYLYAGTFDDGYYSSGTGNLYVCGSQLNTAQRPTLWKIPISGNVMGTPVVGPSLVSNNNADCSPVTEIMNGSNDYIYASVTASGNDTGCTGACVYMYNLTGLTWNTNAVAGAGIPATGGTGGIIVDNISATAGASQIYYSTLGSGGVGTAVQASQAGLQ